MPLQTTASFFVASILTLITFALMQIFKNELGSTKGMTIVGGILGAKLFVLMLTSVSNVERAMFGSTFQSKIFPEVISCLAIAMFASGLVHRVCVTVCFIFSIVALYYVNKLSNQKYNVPVVQVRTGKGKKGQ